MRCEVSTVSGRVKSPTSFYACEAKSRNGFTDGLGGVFAGVLELLGGRGR